MEDVASSHANLIASLRVALHEDLHQFLTPIRMGEVLNLMKPFFSSQGKKIVSKGDKIDDLFLILSGAASEQRSDGQRNKLLTQVGGGGIRCWCCCWWWWSKSECSASRFALCSTYRSLSPPRALF